MLVSFLRTLILYLVIVVGLRLMGKRQLGELQPTELVVTVMISNIATLPIEEIDTPLFLGMLPIFCLVTFEVLISALNLRSRTARRLFSGRPAVIVKNGVLDQQKLRELRFSSDDVMAQLRSSSIFSLDEVDFAVVETTGKLSVYQKYMNRPLTPETVNYADMPQKNSPQLLIVSDGAVLHDYLEMTGLTADWLRETAAQNSVRLSDIFLLTADREGNYNLVKKEGGA